MEVEEKFTRPGFPNLIPQYTEFSRTETFSLALRQ